MATDFSFRGSSTDPYVKLVHGSQSFTTKIVKKCLNPEWHSDFEFHLVAGKHLELTCYDKDTIRSDEFLGSISIDLECMVRPPVFVFSKSNKTCLGYLNPVKVVADNENKQFRCAQSNAAANPKILVPTSASFFNIKLTIFWIL